MSKGWISWGIFVFLCLVWGSSFILMKVSHEELTPVQIAGLRIFSGGVVFLPFAFFHLKKIPRNRILVVLLAGLFGNLLPAFLFTAAIAKLDSSLIGILNSLTPLCVVTLGAVFFRNRIHPQKITGVLIGFAGLCLLTFTQKDISLANLGFSSLVILATFCYGLGVNLVSHYLKEVHPVHVASVSLSFLAIPTFIILWLNGFFELDFLSPSVQWSTLAGLLLGLAGTSLATVLFYILVQKAGGLFASLVTYGIPFVALLWGVVYGEPVTWMEILCLCIILAGVYLANRKR